MDDLGGQVVAAISILALGAVNYIGIQAGNRLQAALTVLKVAALASLPDSSRSRSIRPRSCCRRWVPLIACAVCAFGVVS